MSKRFLIYIFIMLLFTALSGCASSKPKDSLEFAVVQEISGFEGVYQNLGESEPGLNPVYLSSLIWKNENDMDHASILSIGVRVRDVNTILFTAFDKNGPKEEAEFIRGRDFEFKQGRLYFTSKLGMFGLEVGEPLVGPYYLIQQLGVDQEGHGRYREEVSFVGLGYLVFPLAGKIVSETRFMKIRN